MITEKNTELYDRYLEGKMSTTESVAFLERLKNDNELEKDYNLHKTITEVLRNSQITQMHEMLIDIKYKYERKLRRRKLVIGITTVAASVVLVFFALQLWVFNEKTSSSELFDKYYIKAEHNPTTRGAAQETESEFDSYLMLYHQGQINDALAGFSSVANTSELFLPAKYFSAQCHMQLNAYNEAIKELELVILHRESLFYYDALWYAGLCHLKMNNLDQAGKYFNILAVEENCYSKKAEIIIDDL